MDQTEKWTKIADNLQDISFGNNNIGIIKNAEKSICIAKTSEGLKACSASCPHAGGDLSEGFLDKKQNILCPVHNYRFPLNTGRDALDEGYFLKIYKLKETAEGIFIKLEE